MNYKEFIFTNEEVEQLKNSDPSMKLLIEKIGRVERHYTPDHFGALVSSIVSQQLANKAAEAIWKKLEALIPDMNAYAVRDMTSERLREIGLSNSKVRYIKNVSEAVLSGKLDLRNMHKKDDEAITAELIDIKGVGRWTAEMFLIFSLGRKNVLSYGDLGIRKGMTWLYGFSEYLSKDAFDQIAVRYTPNGTLASLYLWEIGDRKFYKYKSIIDVRD